MKRNRDRNGRGRQALAAAAALAATAACAAIPFRWTVETTRAQTEKFEAYQGETILFEAELRSRGRPLEAPAGYSLYWQTNGMGTAWWSAPCEPAPAATNVLRAWWRPEMDVGARAYTCFIGAPSSNFHASFQLRLRPSPGAVPNALPLPAAEIDFARVAVTNAPWEDGLAAKQDRALGYASRHGSSTVEDELFAIDTDTGCALELARRHEEEKADREELAAKQDRALGYASRHGSSTVDQELFAIDTDTGYALELALRHEEEKADREELAGKADLSDVEELNVGYQRLYSFAAGATNANISVTNYPPTAEEAEGRARYDPTDPDLDFATVPASLRIDETRGGAKRTVVDTRDWPVWYFGLKLPKILAAAQEYARAAYTNAVAQLAAWSGRTARGAENPAGDSTLVVDVPNIWLMTDMAFEKHVDGAAACWVIRSRNAAAAPNVTTNGYLEITDAFGEPYVRFNRTEAAFAEPAADGIGYDRSAGEWTVAYSTAAKPKGGANLSLEGSEVYPGKAILKDEDDELCPAVITWTGSAGNWLMHAKPKAVAGAEPGRMFFGAVVEVEGQDYIEYLKPVSFAHIVLPNGRKIAPAVPDNSSVGDAVTWKVVQ